MSKKAQVKQWNSKQKVVRLDQIREEIKQIKENAKTEYRPKFGRQISKLEKEYKKVA